MVRGPSESASLDLVARSVWALEVSLALALLWFALNGFERLLVGLLAAAAGGVLAGALASERPYRWRPLRLVGFVGFFVAESFRGGVDVAWRALRRELPIQPAFRWFRHGLPAGQPRTLLVSILSLLPGTLSADLVDDGATLVVHTLTTGASASVERLQSRIRWLFAIPDEAA
jgi:multicomponent Na+:H+ antiporter subunit E